MVFYEIYYMCLDIWKRHKTFTDNKVNIKAQKERGVYIFQQKML